MGNYEKQVRKVVDSFKVDGKLPESVIIPKGTEIVFNYSFRNGVMCPHRITVDKELRVEAIVDVTGRRELFVIWNRYEDFKEEKD